MKLSEDKFQENLDLVLVIARTGAYKTHRQKPSIEWFRRYGALMYEVGNNSSCTFYLGINRNGQLVRGSVDWDPPYEDEENTEPIYSGLRIVEPDNLGYLGNR